MDPEFIFPRAGSTLRGSIQEFRWDLGNVPLTSAWLYAGSVLGGSQYGSRSVGTDTAASLDGLPTDGSTVFMRVWYRSGGTWLRFDEEFVAASSDALPTITAPSSGGRLAGPSQRFTWTYNGLEVEAAWLYVGTTEGGSDLIATFVGTETATTVVGLPVSDNGSDGPVFTRLFFRVAGSWYFVDDQFEPGPAFVPDLDTLTRQLQGLVGETTDGIIGPVTTRALNRNWLGRTQSFDPSFAARFVNDADLVRWVQGRINTRAGSRLELTGEFDATTEAAVIDHLGKGGVVSAESFQELLKAE